MDALLDKLAGALAEERRAILEHDIEALLRSTQDKVATLRDLEAQAPSMGAAFDVRLRELSEANQANGALLARRRREVNWALRHLGRSESSGAYDANGQTDSITRSRPLAVV